eukprot:scaffold5.g1004.t1
MRFKAVITDRGLNVLHRGFLPTLEKFGKSCQLLLSPEDGPADADGLVITARLANSVLFDPEGFRCVSRQSNNIVFSVDIALFAKVPGQAQEGAVESERGVLKSAVSYEAEALEMKLAMRALPSGPNGAPNPERPTLSFSWRGQHMTMVQDMPISAPYSAERLQEVLRWRDVGALCPFYLDVQLEQPRIQVDSPCVHFGSEVRGLQVLPAAVAEGLQPLESASAAERLEEAADRREAAGIRLQVKHLAKALHSSQATQPAQLLAGVAPGGAYLHVMFVYRDPGAMDDQAYDDNVSLSYKLPPREE